LSLHGAGRNNLVVHVEFCCPDRFKVFSLSFPDELHAKSVFAGLQHRRYKYLFRLYAEEIVNVIQAVRKLMPPIGHKSCIYDSLYQLDTYLSNFEEWMQELDLKPDGLLEFYYFCFACVISLFLKVFVDLQKYEIIRHF